MSTKKLGEHAFYIEKGEAQRQGNEDTYAVSTPSGKRRRVGQDLTESSGLDNAGKTTIVKRIMDEDVNTISPTLGFIIKTIEYDG